MFFINWVSRKANGVAHELAKFTALNYEIFAFCNQDSLPPTVKEAWLRDDLYPD